MAEVWRAATLRIKTWPDGVVVYHVASGNTHLLNPTAGQVLKLLVDGPADETVIAHRLAGQMGLKSDAELVGSVARLLVYLDSLGLIEPVSA